MRAECDSIVGAFSKEQVSRLTRLSRAPLRRWNNNGFIRPEYPVDDSPRKPFSRIYSFKDLLKLRVHNRRVVFEEPESSKKREVASKQFVAEIALEIVTSDARRDIPKLNRRDGDRIGKIENRYQVHSSEPVFSGTGIPVSAVLGFLDTGYSDQRLLDEFQGLEPDDLQAARAHADSRAA